MRRLLIFSVVLLSACGTIQPRVGMTVGQLDKQSRRSGCNSLEMVIAEGDLAVYHVRTPPPPRQQGELRFDQNCNPNIFYYFQNDQLVKIDQGQLYQQRYKIDINR